MQAPCLASSAGLTSHCPFPTQARCAVRPLSINVTTLLPASARLPLPAQPTGDAVLAALCCQGEPVRDCGQGRRAAQRRNPARLWRAGSAGGSGEEDGRQIEWYRLGVAPWACLLNWIPAAPPRPCASSSHSYHCCPCSPPVSVCHSPTADGSPIAGGCRPPCHTVARGGARLALKARLLPPACSPAAKLLSLLADVPRPLPAPSQTGRPSIAPSDADARRMSLAPGGLKRKPGVPPQAGGAPRGIPRPRLG